MSANPNKLQHLRQTVAKIESQSIPSGMMDNKWLEGLPFFRARMSISGQVVGIPKKAGLALINLTDSFFKESEYARGITFGDLVDQLAHLIIEIFGDDPGRKIDIADLDRLETELRNWFKKNSAPSHLYIPCALTTVHGRAFKVGPVSFTHITDFVDQERKADDKMFEVAFHQVLSAMQAEAAHWMATVDVLDCTKKRSWEIGDLAVDIALTGLQLVIPLNFSQRMARMTARNLPRNREMVCRVNGVLSSGGANQQPALAMGTGVLEACLHAGTTILEAVGRRVESYLTGTSDPLCALEQAWCDAVYWFHEGLAEPLDTIAVPKLETAIEVLLRAESSSGSKARILKAIKTFHGLDATQFINADVPITVERFAEGFVRDRSRILHGTWSTLNYSLRDSRPSLTALVHGLLINYVLELDTFATDPSASDNVDTFLNWVTARRAAPV